MRSDAPRSYGLREAWAEAAPSAVEDIPGFTRRDDLLDGFSVFERVTSLLEIVGNGEARVKQNQFCFTLGGQDNHRSDPKNQEMVPHTYGSPLGTLAPFGRDDVWQALPLAARCSSTNTLKRATWVSFDTEYTGGEGVAERWDGRRRVVSWQLGFASGDEFVGLLIVPRTTTPLSIDDMLHLLASYLDVPSHRYEDYPRLYDEDGRWDGKSGTSRAEAYPLVFFAHAGLVDWSTLAGGKWLLQRVQNKGAALFSATIPVTRVISVGERRLRFWRFSLYLRDTSSFAGNGTSLAKLGDAVGLPKLDMSEEDYLDMAGVLEREPERFAAYAMRDVEIAYRYMAQLPVVEQDTLCPPTIPACSANYVKRYISHHLQLDNQGFEEVFRGEVKVEDGLGRSESGRSFYMRTHYEAVNVWADELIAHARNAYHGGINTATEVGFFPETSWDYDLTSAYPLALGALYDPDYSQPFAASYENEWLDRQTFLHDWLHDPFVPGFGVVHFEFPESCYHPCIPIKTPNGLVFPRTSEGTSGVYVSAAEVMLALAMGAKVYALRFIVPYVYDRDGILLHAYHDLTRVRDEQKALHGKKSVQQEAVKLVNNSGYGKLAQDLSPKVRRDLWSLETDEIAPSKVTSAPHASAATAIVRCTITAAINQLHALGFHVYSATTDGFISDAPKEVLDRIDLYGLRYRLAFVRGVYTDGMSHDIFETKHTNTGGLLNFTTRGNVGLNVSPDPKSRPELEGVMARAGYKGYDSRSLDDRKAFAKRIVTRSAPLEYEVREWVSAADMLRHDEDFHTTPIRRSANPNFDLKRKPVLDTMREVAFDIDGEGFSTPTYDTEPYASIEEFIRYKAWASHYQLTRRETYVELDERARSGTPKERTTTQRDLVRYAVTAYRGRIVDIPELARLRGQARLDFITSHIEEGRPFSSNDWKHCGRPERVSSLPDIGKYIDVVIAMGGHVVGVE